MTNIAVINESSIVKDAEIKGMLAAFQTQWNDHLAPVWGIDKAAFNFYQGSEQIPPDAWWLVWLDDSDQADALAYHDVTDKGLPLSKVFAATIKADKASLSVAASHELVEMAVDPTINLAAQDSRGVFWAYESADPVEADKLGYDINGVRVTDFLLPSWYDFKGSSSPFDYRKHCTDAFQVLRGGYAQRFDPQHGWVQVNAHVMQGAKAVEAAHGSRRERRARGRAYWNHSGNHEYRGVQRDALAALRKST